MPRSAQEARERGREPTESAQRQWGEKPVSGSLLVPHHAPLVPSPGKSIFFSIFYVELA